VQSIVTYWVGFSAITWREIAKFLRQTERLISAVVRPALWLIVFAAGLHDILGVSIVPPYTTYVPYQEYVLPGLIGVVILFQCMQSALSMVYDREAGVMRAMIVGFGFPGLGFIAILPGVVLAGLMLGSIGLLVSVYTPKIENFAGMMNFVVFPMFFISSALYPLWKLREAGADIIYWLSLANPFTYAIELIRFSAYGRMDWLSLAVVIGVTVVAFFAAAWGYDPQKGSIRRVKRD
jgi:ABC-2 type transport system permease protein